MEKTPNKTEIIKAYNSTDKNGKLLLENLYSKEFFNQPIPVTERIKSIKNVLKDNGLTQSQLDKQYKDLPEHVKNYYILTLICKSLNEGWTPDWSNSSEYKYYPWFEMGSSGFRYGDCDLWNANANVGSHLCFKTKELAIFAGTNPEFAEIYKNYMIIN